MIKEFFLSYNECLSNDFVISDGGKNVELFNNDICDWRITMIDTGHQSNIGQRLMAVKEHLAGEEMFMANYSDGLCDLDLNSYVANFNKHNAIASFLSVRPSQSFHAVHTDGEGVVKQIIPIAEADFWINGGFMILRDQIFDYMQHGEELVEKPFARLIPEKKLLAYKYSGFWASMDTFKDKKRFDELYETGNRPWEVWRK
jgi:glucose-1-phosphate cytidylyltransferase